MNVRVPRRSSVSSSWFHACCQSRASGDRRASFNDLGSVNGADDAVSAVVTVRVGSVSGL